MFVNGMIIPYADYTYFSVGGFEGAKIYISLNKDDAEEYTLFEGTNCGEDVQSGARGCPHEYIFKALNLDQENPYGWSYINNVDSNDSMKAKILSSIVHFPKSHQPFVAEYHSGSR